MDCLHNSKISFKKLFSFEGKCDVQGNTNAAGDMDLGSENQNLSAPVPDSALGACSRQRSNSSIPGLVPRTSMRSPQPLFKKEGDKTNEEIDYPYVERLLGYPPLFQRGARGDLKHPREK